jgi:hypothetical protein
MLVDDVEEAGMMGLTQELGTGSWSDLDWIPKCIWIIPGFPENYC